MKVIIVFSKMMKIIFKESMVMLLVSFYQLILGFVLEMQAVNQLKILKSICLHF